MEQDGKQSAVQRLASAMSRAAVEVALKDMENTLILQPYRGKGKPVSLKDSLRKLGIEEAGEFRDALRQYIYAYLESYRIENNYQSWSLAEARLEKACLFLLPHDVSEKEISMRQGKILDMICDATIASDYASAQRTSREQLGIR